MQTQEKEYRDHFDRFGFIHLKGVLEAKEISAIRENLHKAYDALETNKNYRVRDLLPPDTFTMPEIYRLPLKERIVQGLKAILEPNYTMLPDLLVSKNQAGLHPGKYNKHPGWHWDSSSEGKQSYFYDPGYRFVKCGLYLQENTEDYGGGVDIVPGRHTFPLTAGGVNLNFKVKNLVDLFGMYFRSVMAKLEPGDFLAFHSCLPHRSTLPKKLLPLVTGEDLRFNSIAAVPREKTKFTIYFDACRAGSLDGYWNNLIRKRNGDLKGQPDWKTDTQSWMLSRHFPEDYPADFVSMADKAGVRMAS